jgi:glycosyltransferase involved in cell wall biosynthesis
MTVDLMISIVTITLNSEKHLEQTIQSVINQSYKYIEYIVVDGGSTDRTLDIINRYNNDIAAWVSEPDRGISDAMNKGLSMATGSYVLFLHSDDYLIHPNVLDYAAEYLIDSFDIVMFSIVKENADGEMKYYQPRGLKWWINFKTGIYHQSAFCSRDMFRRVGLFDIQLKICMDYDLFLRSYRRKCTTHKIDFPLTVMRSTGISSRKDWQSLEKRFMEEKYMHKKNCHSHLLRIMYHVYWLAYPLYRKIKYNYDLFKDFQERKI